MTLGGAREPDVAVGEFLVEHRPSVWHTVESTVSVFFAFVVGFVVAVFGGNLAYLSRDDPQMRWFLPTWLAVLAAECAFLLGLKRSLERGDLRPFIPRFALRQYRWPVALRPIVACWWLAHFGSALGVLWLVERAVAATLSGAEASAAVMAALALATWILTHCGLMYLLLALTALWRSERLVMTLWRWRLAVDLFFTAALLAASQLGSR